VPFITSPLLAITSSSSGVLKCFGKVDISGALPHQESYQSSTICNPLKCTLH